MNINAKKMSKELGISIKDAEKACLKVSRVKELKEKIDGADTAEAICLIVAKEIWWTSDIPEEIQDRAIEKMDALLRKELGQTESSPEIKRVLELSQLSDVREEALCKYRESLRRDFEVAGEFEERRKILDEAVAIYESWGDEFLEGIEKDLEMEFSNAKTDEELMSLFEKARHFNLPVTEKTGAEIKGRLLDELKTTHTVDGIEDILKKAQHFSDVWGITNKELEEVLKENLSKTNSPANIMTIFHKSWEHHFYDLKDGALDKMESALRERLKMYDDLKKLKAVLNSAKNFSKYKNSDIVEKILEKIALFYVEE